MGWTYKPGPQAARREGNRRGHKPNLTQLARTMGLRERGDGRHNACQAMVTYDTAERLCKALGMDPFEAGI